MDRLPEPLTSFRQIVEADLRRAARLIIKVQDEIIRNSASLLCCIWEHQPAFPK